MTSNKKRLILIIVSGLLVVAFAAVAMRFLLKSQTSETPKETSSEKSPAAVKVEEETETEVTDAALKKHLLERVAILNGLDKDIIVDNAFSASFVGFYYDLYKNQLTNSEKISLTAISLEDSFSALDPSDPADAALAVSIYNANPSWYYYGLSDIYSYDTKISADRVLAEAESLFGEKLEKETSIGNCHTYVYNEEYDIFYTILFGCGGTGMVHNFYVNRVTKKGDAAYVYLNASSSAVNDQGGCDVYTYLVEAGTARNTDLIYDSCVFSEDAASPITAENFSAFKEYRFTFKKSASGDYYFTGVE